MGIAVINAAVSKAGPLEDEVFKLDIRYGMLCLASLKAVYASNVQIVLMVCKWVVAGSHLSKPNGWLFWGILGVIAAPFVVGACATFIQAVGYEVCHSPVALPRTFALCICGKPKMQMQTRDYFLQDLVTDKRGTVDGVCSNVECGSWHIC